MVEYITLMEISSIYIFSLLVLILLKSNLIDKLL